MGRFDNYKFRCSALGKVISKSGRLTDANKAYLTEVFIGEMNGIRKEIHSKYFEKGKFMEEDGITLLNQTLHPDSLIIKNKERKSNDFIHGEADCIVGNCVYDIKNAWDRFTFGKASLTHEYEWQLRGYMWLWIKEKARLFYCLNNMPEHMLINEERKLFYANFFVSMDDPEYLKLCEELRQKHTYDQMKLYERFRLWEIEHSAKEIEKAKESISQARKFLNDLFEEWQGELRKNIELMGLDYELTIAQHDPSLNTTIVSAA